MGKKALNSNPPGVAPNKKKEFNDRGSLIELPMIRRNRKQIGAWLMALP
jgi:hypothetical protein